MRESSSIRHLQKFAFDRLQARDSDGLASLIFYAYPNLNCAITIHNSGWNPLVVKWKLLSGRSNFQLVHTTHLDLARSQCARFLSMLHWIEQVHLIEGAQGQTEICLEDAGLGNGLCFCTNNNFSKLIPDPDFFSTSGYNSFREIAKNTTWEDKIDTVFWRGSSTGITDTGLAIDLPRVRLCLLAKEKENYDIGLINYVQLNDAQVNEIKDLGVYKSFAPQTEIIKYKFNIDIDGNTNAWSSLFCKLLSGGAVLKVCSPRGFRQWYYDQLIPWFHFIPVAADLSDLDQIVTYLRNNDELAKQIAYQGQQLALSMNFERHTEIARDRAIGALREGLLSMASEPIVEVIKTGNFQISLLSVLLENAFNRGVERDGKLSTDVLAMEGMSGRAYRYTINNLVASVPRARYLEVGSWAGSTACAASEGNRALVVCVDNWSEFGGPKDVFLENIQKYKGPFIDFELIIDDFRKVDYGSLSRFNIYLFDGPHMALDQKDGLELVLPALDEIFIFIVNDWNWSHVRDGIRSTIESNGIEVLYSIEVRSTLDDSHPIVNRQHSDWHNGCFMSVLRNKNF